MIEQRLERLQNEIKGLKASMPIAGSLIDIYFYTKVFTKDFADGVQANWLVKFTPIYPDDGLGFTIMYEYCEALSTDGHWSQFNPVFLVIDEGYYVNSSGQAVKSDGFIGSGFGTYTARVTASIYSTVPGTLSIEWT